MGKRSRRRAKVRAKPKQAHAPETKPRSEAEKDARLIELLAKREQLMNEAAYRMFLEEGGHVIEQSLENGQLTGAAYHSQIRAEKEGGSGWGPVVTPYEDRMTRGLQLRLMREKRAWIKECRRRIQEQWDALAVDDIETDEPEAEEADQPEDNEYGNPRTKPAPETEAANEPVLSTTSSP